MTNYAKLPTWVDKSHVYAVVETPRGSHAKLEFDPKLQVFTMSKPLITGLSYPYDWGFIPSTKADDGDPIDVLIIHEAATYPGLVMQTDWRSRNRPNKEGKKRAQRPHLCCAQSLTI